MSGTATAIGVGIEAGMGAGIATVIETMTEIVIGSVTGSVIESVIGNVSATGTGTFCEVLRRSQPRPGRRGGTKSRPNRPRSK